MIRLAMRFFRVRCKPTCDACDFSCRVRSAFTLVELLAALILAVFLIAGMTGIAGRLAKQRRQLEVAHPHLPWRAQLEERMSRDYENCSRILVRPRSIQLQGFSYTHFESFRPEHLPVEVSYELVRQQTGDLLIRTERHLTEPTGENQRREVLCVGIERIELKSELEMDVPPGVLELNLLGTAEGRPFLIPMVLVRHGGLK